MNKMILSAITLGLLSTSVVANNQFVSIVTCDENLVFSIDDSICGEVNSATPPAPIDPATHPWYLFAKAHGQLTMEADVTGYERRGVNFGGAGNELNDVDLPQMDIGVSKIEGIGFANNNLTHLNFLNGVDTLNNGLYFSDNNINDISKLIGITNTNTGTNIYLQKNNLTNVNGLDNISVLDDLYLYDNNISNISGLSGLTQVDFLWLSQNNINDLTPIKDTVFKSLLADNNNISDIGMLQINSGVEYLSFANNNISDVSSLSSLSNLNRLNLTNNTGITDISSLINNSGVVEDYQFTSTSISNTDGLDNITEYTILSLNDISTLTNINGLRNVKKITSLRLNNNPNLTNLDGLWNLTESSHFLDFSISGLTNVNGLYNLENAHRINLDDNPNLIDISGLSNLTSVSDYVILEEPSQYIVKLKKTSPFCVNYNNGNIALVRTSAPNYRTISYNEICVDDNGVVTPPANGGTNPDSTPNPPSTPVAPPSGSDDSWMEFFNSYDNISAAYDSSYNHIIMTNESEIEFLMLEIYDVDSKLPTENIPLTQHDDEIYISGPTHVNYLSSLTSAWYLDIDDTVEDITGLENIAVVNQEVYFYDPSTITKKADINSDFCLGLDSGDVWAYDDNGDLFKSDLCE